MFRRRTEDGGLIGVDILRDLVPKEEERLFRN